MVWRAMLPAQKRRRVTRKDALQSRVDHRIPIGILGYHDGVPIAWCSIAPRASYRRLGGLDDFADDPDAVWSLVCFFIKRALRGQGISDQVLAAAIAHARDRGARIVEAYPVDPDSPSYLFMGFVPLFELAGFKKVGTAGTRRHVMRLDVG